MRARAGIELARSLGFRVKIVATVDAAWWHPVAITDPSMQVASLPLRLPLPVATVLAVVAATVNARRVDPDTTLQAFRCT